MTERLTPVVPDAIWHAQQPLRFGPLNISTRMTVVRLDDGSLWVHSPIAPSAPLLEAIARLGRVRDVVAPNRSHHLFFGPFIDAQPGCRGWIAPGLAQKRPDLAGFSCLDAPEARWGELEAFFVEGLPVLNETVWFHHASGTLILTDLLFCFGVRTAWVERTLARVLGVHGRLAMSRTMKLLVKDRRALAGSVAPLLALPVKRVIVAHDQIIEADAAGQLRAAFDWLG